MQLDWNFNRHADPTVDPKHQHEKRCSALHAQRQYVDKLIHHVVKEETQIVSQTLINSLTL